MVRVCKNQKESVLAMVRKGKLDAASLSTSNLVDEIILAMAYLTASAQAFLTDGHTIRLFHLI